jgi:hypothetical protein
MNFLLWTLPFLVLMLSFLSFRVDLLKSLRYKIYILILFIAFILDLTHMSFINDVFDTIRFLLVTFILGDFLWNVTRIRKPKVRVIFTMLGIISFCWVYMSWTIDGPRKNSNHWRDKLVQTYTNHKNRVYVLKERVEYSTKPVTRKLAIFKIKKFDLIEQQVREYKIPEGYENSVFRYGWSNTANGVRLDLINGKDTIWTLGEGF